MTPEVPIPLPGVARAEVQPVRAGLDESFLQDLRGFDETLASWPGLG